MLNEDVFSQIDLNSLLVLIVVYREKSVSKAAICLGVTQPAVSNTLAKLRILFGDSLFKSQSRKLYPTDYSKPILVGLEGALLNVEAVLSRYTSKG